MVGIDAKNKNILDRKYICPKCSLILREPVQLSTCGHRLCHSCINLQHEPIIKCVQCQSETSQNEIMIDRGFKNDMKFLPIDCSLCQWAGTLNNYQGHLDQFHPNPKCKYCGEQFNSVNNFNEHKVLQCKKPTVDCVLKDFGCSEQIIGEKRHEHYFTRKHQVAILKIIHQIRLKLYDTQIGSGLPQTTTDDSITTQLQTLYDTQHLNDESRQTLAKDFSQIKLSVEETHSFFDEPEHNQNILIQELLSLKEKINEIRHASHNGTFIWKITNFQQKMIDAQSDQQTSIYSPPFYSSPTGYKMRARLYLDGDGNARRTHMSLFFVLMRSEYDAILKFPFNYKVTFCLYDQTPTQRHIIDSFRPDIESNSFQRPRPDMNIACGIPKFCPLSVIQQEGNPYVRDDTIFIKIMVDFGNMPKTLLPYALSLNPGLPVYVQQAMINQEAEKQTQQQYKHTL